MSPGSTPASTASVGRVYRIEIPALDRCIEARADETLYAAARRAGVRIVGACGGRGSCGSCIVRVDHGRVHRDSEGAHKHWLRACRVQPRSDLVLRIAPRSLAPVVRADVAAAGVSATLLHAPAVAAATVQCAPATLAHPAADAERVQDALAAQAGLETDAVDAEAVAALPVLLRKHDGHIDVRWRACGGGRRISGFARPGAPLLGLAVDLGTTNAAAFLLDLAQGRRLASLGLENPQTAWGADLVTRLDAAARCPATAEAMRSSVVASLDALARDLARAVDAQPDDIADVVVCGNTAMQHLLAGWPVVQLGRAPFVAATREAAELPARSLGLAVGRGTALYLAPSIGGFIGGDHVAALLATEAQWSRPGTTLVMDIGTNTEISLVRSADGGEAQLWSASCPSGPALEGGHIGCGMRAAEGAIERVAVEPDGNLRLQVIGRGAPVGLCGSGVLDALAAFVRVGWIDRRGRIVNRAGADGRRAIRLAVAAGDRPALDLEQDDVRAVQLAKSAIRTGTQLLAAEAGVAEEAIDRFVVAGAFGAYLDLDAAVAVGLLPALPRERFLQVGNAAGLGVQQMLASVERRARAETLARRCRYVELASRADFQKTFLTQIGFPS